MEEAFRQVWGVKVFPTIYEVELFREKGFARRKCKACGRSFWTLNPEAEYCGDQPCVAYSFVGKPPASKPLSLQEAREKFLSFLERHGHRRIAKYPVVARWRDDVYLVGASIYDFQPWVTEGVIPPPANPLAISQPCVRFTDIDLVGKSGRHLTGFEMMAHHAFNSPKQHVYWNHETVEYCFKFFTEELGVNPEKVSFVEDMWSGGGNAGEDFEVVIDGIEVATLVFMHYKTLNGELKPLENMTVDTGYGLERIVWLTCGSPTIYDAIFKPAIGKLLQMAGVKPPDGKLLAEISRLVGVMSAKGEKGLKKLRVNVAEKFGIPAERLEASLKPLEMIYSTADFSRTLIFMLGDGVVPSNAEAGYLARLLVRKILRNLDGLGLEASLSEILSLQLKEVSRDYPEYGEKAEAIFEMARVEEERYRETLKRGEAIVKRLTSEVKAKGLSHVPSEVLLKLYDSHGLTPDYVAQLAEKSGLKTEVPDDFYSQVAKLHQEAGGGEERLPIPPEVEEIVSRLKPTRLLYYEKPSLQEFEAKVVYASQGFLVLDRTAFYAEGGGQVADVGVVKWDGGKAEVSGAYKVGNVIVHVVKDCLPPVGVEVRGMVNWGRRRSLMSHHTATHIIIGAARRLLGEHVWQHGALKEAERARLDITHYARLSDEQVERLEEMANRVVMQDIPVEVSWLPREKAEAKYGFTIYQGGVVPGRRLRIVKIGEWDVEACGGTHCRSTGEVGPIKIVRTERVQDGVERIIFTAGISAVREFRRDALRLKNLSSITGSPLEDLEKSVKTLLEEVKAARKEASRLRSRLARQTAQSLIAQARKVGAVRISSCRLEEAAVEDLIAVASEVSKLAPDLVAVMLGVREGDVRLVVVAGDEAAKAGVHAGRLASTLASKAGGSGGGKPTLGQGGNLRLELAEKTLAQAEEEVKSQLKR
ncbi:MAG: alanyl-tRNA synthetase [Candidatus Hecatellales archaeon B24]|nr:MAG: alanyl-tRNA synthetase [Candidatus Hecatellales archaeon B24]